MSNKVHEALQKANESINKLGFVPVSNDMDIQKEYL